MLGKYLKKLQDESIFPIDSMEPIKTTLNNRISDKKKPRKRSLIIDQHAMKKKTINGGRL